MKIGFLYNIITSPRSTVLGLVGSTTGGAAFLYVMSAMHCDWTQLSLTVLSEAGALLAAPAVVGAAMKDSTNVAGPVAKEVRTVGDDAHDQAGQG